ncbi:hypothetical protein [Hoylesella timonensis]|uniref:Serine/threonine protein kinase n=1 Tax=Hoylesella timonensis S9-PR14 TaxID=1401062 RepID=A0A098YQT9_9BACT|nr:hypothetical protein [Hoylesella timonensis]KGI21741.1 serine/threonine protein kinase [Hoylesella timonensis S9-PR14]
MKTENLNNKVRMNRKRTYIKPCIDIIKLETNYGVMEAKSIAIDEHTPATGSGNAKQFDMSEDTWGDNHEGDIDIFK